MGCRFEEILFLHNRKGTIVCVHTKNISYHGLKPAVTKCIGMPLTNKQRKLERNKTQPD